MKNKIIGISPRYNYSDNKVYLRIACDYIKALEERNFSVIILTPSKNMQKQLAICDGFLDIGGSDFNPSFYNECNSLFLSKDINDDIDKTDYEILNHAMKYHKPFLGICRGHQAICACLGSPLIQDINQANLKHPLLEEHLHYVNKFENFGLAKLLPDQFLVNSYHHQALITVPQDFHILFKNGDIIEVIEHDKLPIVGIQWHPERFNSNESKIIFDYFDNLFK